MTFWHLLNRLRQFILSLPSNYEWPLLRLKASAWVATVTTSSILVVATVVVLTVQAQTSRIVELPGRQQTVKFPALPPEAGLRFPWA
jgi:hypothetical protein